MRTIANLFTFIIGIQHFLFLLLEMFFWNSPVGHNVFKLTAETAASSASLAANQGLYNGFLSAGLIWALMNKNKDFSHSLRVFFLGCVIVAGLYGGYSVGPKIYAIQALPAFVTLVLTLYISKRSIS